jgi:hypothetical protein
MLQERPTLLLLAIPLALWLFAHYFTYKYAVDVPYWDAWEYTELVTGQRPVTIAAIWEQHNEHRIVWQTLFEIAWGRWMSWDLYLASFVPFLFFGAAYTLFIWRAVVTRAWLGLGERALLVSALSLLLFTFRQHDAFLLDMLLCWGILALAIVLFGAGFERLVAGRATRARVAGLAAAVAVATLSTGQGLAVNAFVLGVGLLALLLRKRLHTGLVVVAAVALALAAVYFVGYVKPPHHPSVTAALSNPSSVVAYMLVLLGSPFTAEQATASTIGTLVVVAFLALAAVWFWRERSEALWHLVTRYPVAPISAILLVAVLVGRVGFGPGQAIASRYVPYTLLLIASLGLAALDLARGASPKARAAALAVAVALLTPAWYASYREALHEGWVHRDDLTRWRDCVLQSPSAADRCDGAGVYPVPEELVRRTEQLRAKKLTFFADSR